ncbi:hypothetical protein VE01_05937 [Pseudogymnoascus verrucosus]|uniref:Uncharacterized protein n=1 Tax=Pseudogymnoascus verrucosus TaxID=342668 RepID=A0A1B8GIE3_9PEZI|nr:uncharacterized protein VE01_05937 [Pseudogymnoascus verrucosus]OBT95600.1 hypothetical protein VE01_05937 [Pseudogymnoascus verrucosus]
MKLLKCFFAPKTESSKQALEPSAPDPGSSKEALGISVVTTVANAQVDIIFIHGLTGHRERTWTHEDENEPWFKSLLPKDLPTARIIAYGYDADVVNFTKVASQNTIRDHAVNLMNDLAGHRRWAPGRPIIFVAHSLGGLVCQKALILCTNPTEDAQKDILSSTRGIAFLGTPHAGSDLARFATAVANFVRFSLGKKSNTKLLEVLTKNSEVLADISNGFFTMVRRRESTQMPIALHAFVEELDVDFLGRRVVEPDSARIVGYNSDTIHANHMEMTKFRSATDPGYVKVLSRLKLWIDDDDNTIVLRYANYFHLMFDTLLPGVKLAKSEPPASTMKELCKSSSIRSSVKWLIDSSEYRVWKSASSARLWLHGEHGDGKTVIMSYIFRSLSRYALYPDGIASVFCSCNDSEEGVVASMALQLLRNKNRAKDWRLTVPLTKFQPEDGGVVLIIDGIDKIDFLVRSSFLDIFNKLEKNPRAGIRVLISSEKRDDIQSALRHYPSIDREKERRECLKTLEFQEWNAREIGVQKVERAGKKVFHHKKYRKWIRSKRSSVLWLEGKPGSGKSTLSKFMSDDDKRVDILRFLLDLASPNLNSTCVVKIFIASRPENDINSGLRPVRHHIKLQEVNEEDIRMVVRGWIERMVSEAKCEEEVLSKVKDYIMEYSDGVFMWVTLVLRDLEQCIDKGGYTKLTLHTRLRSLPKELGGKDGFYRAMVDSLLDEYKEDQEHQELGQRILAWVTFAERPLSVTELRDALAIPSGLDRTDLSTYILEDNRPHKLERAILSFCGGLVEVRDSHDGRTVQLIHQTAREFLLHKDKLAGPYRLEHVQGVMEIAMACCRYLSIVFRPDLPLGEANAVLPEAEIIECHLSGKSLLIYALVNFQTHLDDLGSNDEKVRNEFMDFVKLLIMRSSSFASLLLGQWIQALKWPSRLHVDETSARLYLHSLLLCAAETGNREVAAVLLSLRSDLLHIVASIAAANEDAYEDSGGLELLLNMGADFNAKDTVGRTPVSYAAGNGLNRNTSLLLKNKAEPNLKDRAGRTPLSYASENGHEASVRLLLEREDVELNSEDTTGRTPLSYATANGHTAVAELLQSHVTKYQGTI